MPLAIGVVVIDDPDPHTRQRHGIAGLPPYPRALRLHGGGEAEMEGRSPTELALHPHAPTHQLGEPLADRKPEAGAAELALRRRVDLAEGAEQPVEAVLRNADAGVAHRAMQF